MANPPEKDSFNPLEPEPSVAAFLAGVGSGLEPVRDYPPVQSRRTTLSSDWYMRSCTRCDHSFREGDLVEEMGDPGEFVHEDRTICQETLPGGDLAFESRLIVDFRTGLYSDLQAEGIGVCVLKPGDRQLAPKLGGFERRTCPVCGHSFRRYDTVIICPCFPQEPKCSLAIHNDPFHGLDCWNDWRAGGTNTYCLATSRSRE